jgi:hypothetical protein
MRRIFKKTQDALDGFEGALEIPHFFRFEIGTLNPRLFQTRCEIMKIVGRKVIFKNTDMLEFCSLAQYFFQRGKVGYKTDLIHFLPAGWKQALIFHQFPDLVEPCFNFEVGWIYQGCLDLWYKNS